MATLDWSLKLALDVVVVVRRKIIVKTNDAATEEFGFSS